MADSASSASPQATDAAARSAPAAAEPSVEAAPAGSDPAGAAPHPHDFETQKRIHRDIRNDPDYDDWDYGTEPLPHEAWRSSGPPHGD
jgi:hypothetical protein